MRPELRPGWDCRQLDRSPLARGMDQAPVGDFDLAIGSVKKLDELIAEADLVNLDRESIPYSLESSVGLRFSTGPVGPFRFAGYETRTGR